VDTLGGSSIFPQATEGRLAQRISSHVYARLSAGQETDHDTMALSPIASM
jgi:hypothetical protein